MRSGCRKPAGPGALCTLEACASALRTLHAGSGGEAIEQALLRALLAMVAHQRRLSERIVHRRDRKGYIPGLLGDDGDDGG